MYYRDMTTYKYGGKEENSYNIGWLERGHLVKKGEVPPEFVDKLWKYLRYPVKIYRGFQQCTLCLHTKMHIPIVEHNGERRNAGYYEMRVWGKNGKVYAAPSLIFHYITCHQYKPPQEFIDAVMEAEDPDSEEYYQKVLKYSGGDEFWLAEDRTKLKPSLRESLAIKLGKR